LASEPESNVDTDISIEEAEMRRRHPSFVIPFIAAGALTCDATARAGEPIIIHSCHPGEDGVLTGGRYVVDPSNPADAAAWGLEDVAAPRIPWDVTTIIDNGPTDNRVDLVMIGDGYTVSDLDDYEAHVNNVVGTFFAEEPLAAYATYFNVHRVDVISNESGVDEPDLGIFRDTALGMRYFCNGIDRLLCINTFQAATAANQAPDTNQTLALANSSRYGGAGYPSNNLGTLAGSNSAAVEIALHEFGHAFADLADEYDYGGPETYTGPEPAEADLTIFTAAQLASMQTKWYRWLNLPHVDTFEGGGYSVFGIYRPTSNSKMRALYRPFEEVNVEQFVISMYELVDPIDGVAPPTGPTYVPSTEFSVDALQPTDHALSVQWFVDGSPVAGATGPTFVPSALGLSPGNHTVMVQVVDNTTRVRDEGARAALMTATRSWLIAVQGADFDGDGDVDLADFATFGQCFGGPNLPPAPGCPAGVDADLDGDGDVDLADFAAFSQLYTGAS
jgi:hypothetical protein